MKKVMTLAAVLSVAVAMPAMAGDKGHHKGHYDKSSHHFKEIDKNGDGVINQSEHHAFMHKMFREADKNKDQLISKRELKDHMHQQYAEHHRNHHHHGHYDEMSPAAGKDYRQEEYDYRPRSGSAQDRRIYGNSSNF